MAGLVPGFAIVFFCLAVLNFVLTALMPINQGQQGCRQPASQDFING
jgi:hypothetical protein